MPQSSSMRLQFNRLPVEEPHAVVAPHDASIPFNRPSIVGRELDNIVQAIRRGQLSGDGHFTAECNAIIARLTGSASALLTHSGTAALEMAAILCDLKPGDEVILPSFTFVSTANAVVLRGATPVFVDIDPVTLNLDPAKVADAVSPRTRAIFAVHYAGFPADMDALAAIADAHGLLLVEDAAQALGSTYKGRPAGSLGDMGAFSFHETKNILSGEGGALTLNAPQLADRARIIREKGTNRSQFIDGLVDKYTWVDLGSSYLPGELIAAFLHGQLEHVGEITRRRRRLFDRYLEGLAALPERYGIGLPRWNPAVRGNGHMFYLLLRNAAQRSAFIAAMREAGVGTPFHYVPLHSSPGGQHFGRTAGEMEHTDRTAERLVRLPMFFDLEDGIERVIDTCLQVVTRLDGSRASC
ncbi:dTDP-4-amino-4,6-dideoxygalactose transaminase [Sphingomonas kaistensis]|uniref:dTDP-4-amino-4,6-dideoxygalactose transaminase n=1 Tax=Sphingomonas kaistensis TaxID=298708 RepID=A0A7X5Y905_9SPHN|nr:dTDP-4-amino-4,6-dideoxygalactose transaminase [Sphingomonas kaistensis]NJC06115.1 dTDP-4-amino-4,6-dideoxygalactose transaminase [Sphingomonas kaistensis]